MFLIHNRMICEGTQLFQSLSIKLKKFRDLQVTVYLIQKEIVNQFLQLRNCNSQYIVLNR